MLELTRVAHHSVQYKIVHMHQKSSPYESQTESNLSRIHRHMLYDQLDHTDRKI